MRGFVARRAHDFNVLNLKNINNLVCSMNCVLCGVIVNIQCSFL